MNSGYNNENKSYESQSAMDNPQSSSDEVRVISIPASRGDRLTASIVDGIIFIIPFTIFVLSYYGFGTYMEKARESDFEFIISNLMACIAIDMIFNGYLLYRYGQTIGKSLLDIKIVDMNDNIPLLTRSYLLRKLLFQVLAYLPFMKIFSIVDVFFIFTKDRRCLHDYLAGTKVVETANI